MTVVWSPAWTILEVTNEASSVSLLAAPDRAAPGPFDAWRQAGLVGRVAADGSVVEVAFQSMNRPDLFGVFAEAYCRDQLHTAPHRHCSCGFYALTDRDLIASGAYAGHVSRPHNVLLKVALSGTVVEGRSGLRASHQTVRSLDVADRCSRGYCRNAPAAVIPEEVQAISVSGRWVSLVPVCQRHRKRSQGVTLRELSDLLGGIPVAVQPPPPPPPPEPHHGAELRRYRQAFRAAVFVGTVGTAAGAVLSWWWAYTASPDVSVGELYFAIAAIIVALICLTPSRLRSIMATVVAPYSTAAFLFVTALALQAPQPRLAALAVAAFFSVLLALGPLWLFAYLGPTPNQRTGMVGVGVFVTVVGVLFLHYVGYVLLPPATSGPPGFPAGVFPL